MKRKFSPSVVTANDLIEGDVIYMTAEKGWTRRLDEARLLTDAETAEAYLRAAEDQPEIAVGPYLAEAVAGPDGRPQPAHFRETFRANGPTNYAHGKQAEAARV